MHLHRLNFPKNFLQKMNQGISKKILYGLPEEKEGEQIIPKIVEQILEKYEEQPELSIPLKPLLIQKFVTKLSEYIPSFSKFMNFWNHVGINYSDEIQKKQQVVAIIYKKIASKAYDVGKKGEKLEISDVKALFTEINFEEKIEPVNIIENTKTLACEYSPIDQKPEKFKIAADLNTPLVNLIMLKALHDGIQQEINKIYSEHCIVEYMYSNNTPTTLYSEQPQYYDNPLLGNNYYTTPAIACC